MAFVSGAGALNGRALSSVRASNACVQARPCVSMKVERRVANTLKSATAGVVPALAAIAPALATEGTGEALGIDSPLLFIPLLLVPAAFFVLFVQFAGGQDNEDFFGGYDQRRK
mmetsp:Transcript_5433/g.11452  ORF Transcript_5433/g.11452 Transcript_5433/m.11452 type:complete len:114 (-) Transcript_5433:429-770(-)|eukprot:CAMPEP_0185844144 /NCGR_PEP_ID=MMETSP1354-20130828/418_1 /TAXON_ID=708628 /ORGANISM="Erythrolobus madagascarensis, Strain CCMP3276" /LENGTH=113 /DNA_ID=CAMNT_0028543765 /DNA_START=56 /DNA_END=397 /DNA_ORIENTATION=+